MADDDQKKFEERLVADQTAGRAARLDDGLALGLGPDGKLDLLPPGSKPRPFEPVIIDGEDEPEDDFSDLEEDA